MDFKEAIKKQEEEMQQRNNRHAQINKQIISALPGVFDQALSFFLEVATDSIIEVHRAQTTKNLTWASNREHIGSILVDECVFSLRDNSLLISLSPIIGYVGAVAKIELKAKPFQQLPINKEGIFIDIALSPEERNVIKYMDLRNRVHEFSPEIAEEIMRAVFLHKSYDDPGAERWG